jgi:hypothetical protein
MKTITKYLILGIVAVASFEASPQGIAFNQHHPYLGAAATLIGGIALVLHVPFKSTI